VLRTIYHVSELDKLHVLTATNPAGRSPEEVCFRGWQVNLLRFEKKKTLHCFVTPGSLLPEITAKPKEPVKVRSIRILILIVLPIDNYTKY
jgi:hypothetical protein